MLLRRAAPTGVRVPCEDARDCADGRELSRSKSGGFAKTLESDGIGIPYRVYRLHQIPPARPVCFLGQGLIRTEQCTEIRWPYEKP